MAKTYGPLLSLQARGQVGQSLVFGQWRGVPYARQYVTPSNPKSTAQVLTRNVFAMLDELYKRTGVEGRKPWAAEVLRRPLTDRNAFFRALLPRLRGQSDMLAYIGSPGSQGGLPGTAISATAPATAGEIDITLTVSDAPTGWTLSSVVGQAVQNIDPTTIPTQFSAEATAGSPTAGGDNVVNITGLPSGDDYVCCAWPVWTKADGSLAYGPSLTATAAVTTN